VRVVRLTCRTGIEVQRKVVLAQALWWSTLILTDVVAGAAALVVVTRRSTDNRRRPDPVLAAPPIPACSCGSSSPVHPATSVPPCCAVCVPAPTTNWSESCADRPSRSECTSTSGGTASISRMTTQQISCGRLLTCRRRRPSGVGIPATRNIEYLRCQGVGGTAAVLAASHLLHMSSVGTYAPGRYGTPVDESWSTAGIASSPYSRHKAADESLLDEYEGTRSDAGVPITRMRPGFIMQRAAASALMRYALPGYVPMRVVPLLPVLPLDRELCIPLIKSDDVAGRSSLRSNAVPPERSTSPPSRE
jgi:hypothetical protein